MKVTNLEVFLMSYPLPAEHQWRVGRGRMVKLDSIVVKVYTDIGLTGIGEPSPYGGPLAIKNLIEEELKPWLIGKDPFDVEKLTIPRGDPDLTSRTYPTPNTVRDMALAGIDQALWDIVGKAVGLPVYRLLEEGGDYVERVRACASRAVWYDWEGQPQ